MTICLSPPLQVLVELRQWGRDQDAISTVYKALRRVENLETSDEGFSIPSSLDVRDLHMIDFYYCKSSFY